MGRGTLRLDIGARAARRRRSAGDHADVAVIDLRALRAEANLILVQRDPGRRADGAADDRARDDARRPPEDPGRCAHDRAHHRLDRDRAGALRPPVLGSRSPSRYPLLDRLLHGHGTRTSQPPCRPAVRGVAPLRLDDPSSFRCRSARPAARLGRLGVQSSGRGVGRAGSTARRRHRSWPAPTETLFVACGTPIRCCFSRPSTARQRRARTRPCARPQWRLNLRRPVRRAIRLEVVAAVPTRRTTRCTLDVAGSAGALLRAGDVFHRRCRRDLVGREPVEEASLFHHAVPRRSVGGGGGGGGGGGEKAFANVLLMRSSRAASSSSSPPARPLGGPGRLRRPRPPGARAAPLVAPALRVAGRPGRAALGERAPLPRCKPARCCRASRVEVDLPRGAAAAHGWAIEDADGLTCGDLAFAGDGVFRAVPVGLWWLARPAPARPRAVSSPLPLPAPRRGGEGAGRSPIARRCKTGLGLGASVDVAQLAAGRCTPLPARGVDGAGRSLCHWPRPGDARQQPLVFEAPPSSGTPARSRTRPGAAFGRLEVVRRTVPGGLVDVGFIGGRPTPAIDAWIDHGLGALAAYYGTSLHRARGTGGAALHPGSGVSGGGQAPWATAAARC